ncbi:hypothetical protein F5883DRAFT_416139 [Diaporthe sp. PMI_573]|nr:hypothetical protein F5883DRAFT_416139 [Diaporthaceae sp. PMI_573]
MTPKFFVVARVVGRDGALELWRKRLVHLCEVSRTEPYGDSYYWGYDLDGEKDTLWGLEGYTHPIGFFLDHVSSGIFKREMALVDKDELLRTTQGLGSPDYDLHHYDQVGGCLKRTDDPDSDSKTSFVVVNHYWANDEKSKSSPKRVGFEGMQGQEPRYIMVTSSQAWEGLQTSSLFNLLTTEIQSLTVSIESHRSQSFNGHLGLRD